MQSPRCRVPRASALGFVLTITDVYVAKTAASFWALEAQGTCGYSVFFFSQFQQVTWLRSCCWLCFFFFSVVALDPAAGVLPALALASFFSLFFCCQFFFSSFLAFSAAASVLFLDYWEPFDSLHCRATAFSWAVLDCSSRGSLAVSLALSARLPQGYLWLKSWLEGSWSLALAPALVVFLIRLSPPSCSRSFLSMHNFIEGRRP